MFQIVYRGVVRPMAWYWTVDVSNQKYTISTNDAFRINPMHDVKGIPPRQCATVYMDGHTDTGVHDGQWWTLHPNFRRYWLDGVDVSRSSIPPPPM